MIKKTPKKKPNNVRRDPEFMRAIGSKGGLKTKRRRGRAYYSELAKRSHPKNNPNVKRVYVGGRPAKEDDGAVAHTSRNGSRAKN